MTGLSEHRSISAALLRIVTGAVIVLVLLACDNGQPDTPADNGEVMLTLRISLPTATGRKHRHPRHYIQRGERDRHRPTESTGVQGERFHRNIQL
ncbi:MAG: hypothetical protein ACLUHA_05025 [Bacteroides stercoris]